MHKDNTIAETAKHNFKVSEGWFQCWRKRHGVFFTVLKGMICSSLVHIFLFSEHTLNISDFSDDAIETDVDGIHQFCETIIQLLLKSYQPEDI